MSTTTAGATIFYTTNSTTPTHNGSTLTGSTLVYTGPVTVGKCGAIFFEALAYKTGMTDSVVTTYNADYTGYPTCGNGAAMGSIRSEPSLPSGNVTTIIFSVWDGDWAIVEEYTTSNVLVQKYLQGYHGLVKTLVDNIYYYQDELGSTSHIATASGALLESYQYDLYGKPRVYNAGGTYQPGATPVGKDLFTGQRWVSEIGLYDDRNRFMSPDLGRFLQPDPIGFKGDASNLYRYCGNDWANRTDPMGLGERESNPFLQQQIRYSEKLRDQDRGAIMSQMLNVQRINFRDAQKDMAGFSMGAQQQVSPVQSGTRGSAQEARWRSEAENKLGFDKDARAAFQKFGPDARSVEELQNEVKATLAEQYGGVKTTGKTDATGKVSIAPNPNPYTLEATRRHEAVHQHTIQQGIKQYGKGTPAFNRWFANPQRFAQDEVKAYSASIEYVEGLVARWHEPP